MFTLSVLICQLNSVPTCIHFSTPLAWPIIAIIYGAGIVANIARFLKRLNLNIVLSLKRALLWAFHSEMAYTLFSNSVATLDRYLLL